MKNNRSKQRRGFTLVELLIVIVVIGVLSAMMMLSSTEAVSSARASNIVSNLRNLKTAALAWYADHLDIAEASDFTFTTGSATSGNSINSADVTKYMNNESSNSFKDYNITGSATADWYVVYQGALDSRVSAKLAGRAASVGLLNGSSNAVYTEQSGSGNFAVRMKVLEHNSSNASSSGSE